MIQTSKKKEWPFGFFLFPARLRLTLAVNAVSPRAGFTWPVFSQGSREASLDSEKRQALQVAKEIVVKFIEIGRISPNNFPEFFSNIYNEVLSTIQAGAAPDPEAASRKKAAPKDSP